MARRDVRGEMIRGAAELLATQGLQRTSFSEVLAATGAPRGSIYHHFPSGKDELVRAAVVSVGDGVVALIDALDATPAQVVDAFVDGWRAVLVGSDHRRGCAVAATSIGADDAGPLLDVAAEVFRSWREALARALVRGGLGASDADDLALTCLAVVEGALVLGRATRSDEVFGVAGRQLRRLLEA
ncbi:MAG TPA: TetR/AcrR family transcriptional regulator [Aquihabitans sp.]|jgi:AcrR family transcriptional regulator|nr:TetR/AcrR family transcriptional regulator [Aquihabitans sp.]